MPRLSDSAPRACLVVVAFLVLTGCSVEGITGPYTGTTAPGREFTASEDMMVVGDWGSGTSSQQVVADAMAAYADGDEYAAILTTGDNLYSDDVSALMEPYSWTRRQDIPFVIAWGNHDIETQDRIAAVNDAFGNPPRWVHHEWGPVDLLILDSTQVNSSEQLAFIEGAMAASDDPTILLFHHPPYSCGTHGSTEPVLDSWVPSFDEDVILVLNGHEHNYQRFETDAATYVVTGGGGAALTELAQCSSNPPRRAAESVHHFVTMELNDGLVATAVDVDGNVIDKFRLDLP